MQGLRVLLSSNSFQHVHTARALAGCGHQVDYLAPALVREGSWAARLLRDRVRDRTTELPAAVRVRSLRSVELVASALSRFDRALGVRFTADAFDLQAWARLAGHDVLHCHAGTGLRAARRAVRKGAVVVVDERGVHPVHYQRILRETYGRLGIAPPTSNAAFVERVVQQYAEADFIFVASEYARRTFIAEGVPPDRLLVAPYGPPFRFDRAPRPRRASRLEVLFVGRITPAKGIHTLFEAFARVDDATARLTLVGPVEPTMQAPFERLLASESRAGWRKPVPHDELPTIYQGASVLVLPTMTDSFGFVALEAVANALPVIVTDNAGVADVFEDGVTGFVVPTGDVEALAARLETLRQSPETGEALAAAALDRIPQRCTWDRYADAVCEGYRTVAVRVEQRRVRADDSTR